MYLNQKDWSCPKKQKARLETIISQVDKLSKNKQYWTMCGQCATIEGKPVNGCEATQIIESGLISADQFHGVEINKEIHDLNALAFPELNWYNDDFYNAMIKSSANKLFNPGVINCDLPKTPSGGIKYVAKIMSFLSGVCDETTLILNFILRTRHYTVRNGDDVIDLLNKQKQFQWAIKRRTWKFDNQYYLYAGSGETGSRTWMGSFIFRLHSY